MRKKYEIQKLRKKEVVSITFNMGNAPEVIDAVNLIASKQDRTAHDAVKRIILQAAEGLGKI